MRSFLKTFLIWSGVSLPAAWLFGVAIQYQWIQQRCGSAELLERNKRLCGDNELRMLFGGPVAVFILSVIFFAILMLFHRYLSKEREAVARRMSMACQVLGLSVLVFLPTFCREETIVAVALLFLVVLVGMISVYVGPLSARLFPGASSIAPLTDVDVRYFRRIFLGALLVQISLSLIGFFHPITDHHSFRQTQTALSTYWLNEGGFKIWYDTPMFGKPWSVPMEFPLYQYTCVLIIKLTGFNLEAISRIVSLASFYGMLYFASMLLKDLRLSGVARYLILTLLVLAPLHIYYARAVLIEMFTLMLAVLWIWASFRFFMVKQGRWLLLGLTAGMACALAKITTFAVFGFFQIGIFWWAMERPFRRNFEFRKILFLLIAGVGLVVLPLAIGAFWVQESDKVKLLNPMIGDHWNSKALREWNFGTLDQRLSFSFWRSILLSNLQDILGYLGMPILLLLIRSLLRSELTIRMRYAFLIVTFLFGPLVFANLYFVHDYYYVACSVFLLVVIGAELGRFYSGSGDEARKNIRSLLVAPLLASMLVGYLGEYFKKQLDTSIHPMERLGVTIRNYTAPGDVVIAHGYASSELPYYAQRKMLVEAVGDVRQDTDRFLKAMNELKYEQIGAVILPTQWQQSDKQRVLDLYMTLANFRGKKISELEGYEVYQAVEKQPRSRMLKPSAAADRPFMAVSQAVRIANRGVCSEHGIFSTSCYSK